MCPKPFSWAKNKRKLFSDGKSRGPLLARVALKNNNKKLILEGLPYLSVLRLIRPMCAHLSFSCA